VVKRLAACLCPCCLASPDARSDSPGGRLAPVPQASPFIGDALGYFAFLPQELVALHDAAAKARSPVCTMNVGCPVVACLNRASTEAFMKGARVTEDTHPFLFEFHSDLFEGQKPNFCQRGEEALKVRRFLQSLMPASEEDVRFKEGLDAIEQMLQKWALIEVDGQRGDLAMMDLEKGTLDVILAFTTTLFLGRTLDPDLLRPLGLDLQVPGATFTPHYPHIPRRLQPCYWGAKATMKTIWKQIRSAPRGPDIMAKAREVGLAEDEACAALLIAMTFNAFGLCNSLVNALLVLKELPRGGQEVIDDKPLLDSVAWELLRHNGPQVTTVASRDVEIPAGLEGPKHLVKRGTVLYSHLGYAQRDATVYGDPDSFKPDRFSPLPPRGLRHRTAEGREPLPTLGFGCPLGLVDDEEQRANSHQCLFVHLAQPLVRHWVWTLARKFEWVVEETSLKRAASSQASAMPHFDYSVSGLMGNGGTVSMVPKPVKRAGYRLIEFRLRDPQEAIVQAI
jgi:cytochrome P450